MGETNGNNKEGIGRFLFSKSDRPEIFPGNGYEQRFPREGSDKFVGDDDTFDEREFAKGLPALVRMNGKLSVKDRVAAVETKFFQCVKKDNLFDKVYGERRVGGRTGYGYGEGTANGTVSCYLQA